MLWSFKYNINVGYELHLILCWELSIVLARTVQKNHSKEKRQSNSMSTLIFSVLDIATHWLMSFNVRFIWFRSAFCCVFNDIIITAFSHLWECTASKGTRFCITLLRFLVLSVSLLLQPSLSLSLCILLSILASKTPIDMQTQCKCFFRTNVCWCLYRFIFCVSTIPVYPFLGCSSKIHLQNIISCMCVCVCKLSMHNT